MARSAPQSSDPLHAGALRQALPPRAARRVARLDVYADVDSTSAHLLRRSPPPAGQLNVCIADHQTAGRGRLGRRWSAPPGAALMLSVGWLYPPPPPLALAALPLAAGVAARRALERSAGLSIALKWPNDLVWDGRKLGGILVDTARADGATHVVIGIGINVAMPQQALDGISDWPRGAVDLSRALAGPPPRRQALAVALIDDIGEMLANFDACAAAYLEEFAEADGLRGRRVTVREARLEWTGIARGIERDGALIVETDGGAPRRVLSGDVSIRYAS